jgi:hypothetical protein
VTGDGCDSAQLGSGNCAVPQGFINYSGSSGAAPQQYYLEVPDWVAGPSGSAAMETPDWAMPSGVGSDYYPAVYAISVPLNPGAAVSSVTLPDVGSVISVAGQGYTALHIVGMAVSNTTTATPGGAALPAGQTWTGSWASPMESVYYLDSGASYGNQTYRIVTQASAGGSSLRLRLSDSMDDWDDNSLSIGHVTVAATGAGGAISGTPVTATFGGAQSVTIPQGGDVYSDPVGFSVAPGASLTVSIYLKNLVPGLAANSICDGCTQYMSAGGSGDQTTTASSTPFSGDNEGQFDNILAGIDVLTSGTPTAAVLGDNLIDGWFTHGGTGSPWPGVSGALAASLDSAAGPGQQPAFGVVQAGHESDDLLTDQEDDAGGGSVSPLSQLGENVLSEPGLGTVVVSEGLEDLLQAGDSSTIEDELIGDGYDELASLLNAWGISVVFETLTPCAGYAGDDGATPADSCSTTGTGDVDGNRSDLDSNFLLSQFGGQSAPCALAPCTFANDADAAVTNGASPEALATVDDLGDHANLTPAGQAAVAATIPPDQLTAVSPPDY